VITAIEAPLSLAERAKARVLRWSSPAGRRQPKPDAALVHLEGADDLTALRRIAEGLRQWPQAQLALVAATDDLALLMDALPEVDGVMWTGATELVALAASSTADAGKTLLLTAEVSGQEDRRASIDGLLECAQEALAEGAAVALSLRTPEREGIHSYRLLATRAAEQNIDLPILLQALPGEEPLLGSSILLGSLLCDGIGDAVMIGGPSDSSELAFNILQASGTRIFKTDYVACPSCGRTLFDLQDTTERIKQRTSHLVGVKLAIMGCIVNGPGEMADADFGYVGGAPGQVNLYVGKECVEKGVPADEADDRLVELIKTHGKWQEADEA
jgi:hypothetical protein